MFISKSGVAAQSPVLNNETIIDIFWERVKTTPDRPALFHKVDDQYRPIIWREHGKVVELAAGGLLSRNVQKGDKVSIICTTQPQWIWSDLANLTIGSVTVPVYPTLAAREVEYLLRHSDSVGVFVENQEQLEKVLRASGLPEQLRFAVLLHGRAPASPPGLKVLTWADLLEDGEVYLPTHTGELQERIKNIHPEDLATIVYTSGTTGIPKGAMITHSNIYAVCQSLSHLIGFHPDDLALSFLPLSHIFERVVGEFMAVYEGLMVAYAESIEMVVRNMMEVHPVVIRGVPRFYEKIYSGIRSEIRKLPKPQQYLIRWALALGKRASRYKHGKNNGKSELASTIYKAELRVADRLVFSKIRNRFGGRIRFMASGAAPLSLKVFDFFETIGMPIVEGYGLTETCAPITTNTPNGIARGTVGRPLPGVEIKIAADGEIFCKGPSIFAGYYKDPPATAEAFKDGWFATGDIGSFDESGNLIIKDRKKDIIITAGGKHIAPQYIESMFAGEPLIGHIMVYGDRRKYLTALIAVNTEGLGGYAQDHRIPYADVGDLIHNPLVHNEIRTIVEKKNQRLASFEQIKKFLILDHDFSIAAEELTPTLKIRRRFVTQKYHNLLDTLYEAEDIAVEAAVET